MAFGLTVTDKDMASASLIQKAISRQAEQMLVGKNAVPIQRVKSLDIRLAIPTATYLEAAEVAEGARADFQALEWYNTDVSMKKYQTVVRITHEAVARKLLVNQLQMSINAAANGLQIAKDKEIFDTLSAGAGQEVTVSTAWNDSGAAPEDDIAKAIGKIANNTVITDQDLKNMNLFVPAALMGDLKKRVEVENMRVPLERAIQDEYGIKIYYTRQLSTDALLVVKSQETAIHFEYNGTDVPTVEEAPIPGIGKEIILTYFFKTVVVPDSEGESTNNRICKLTGVYA